MFEEHQIIRCLAWDMVKNNTRMIDRAQNVGKIECQAKKFILYSSNNGDPGKSFEKENDTFRFVQ